jgi:hypothetical protein
MTQPGARSPRTVHAWWWDITRLNDIIAAGGDHSSHLLLKNFYRVRLARSAKGWTMTRVRIDNVWMSGDGRVLFPQQPPRAPA